MSRSVSCQQFELYSAEGTIDVGRTFGRAEDAQAFVDGMRDHAWWQRNFPNVKRVEVRFIPSGSGSVGGWFEECACGVCEMAPSHRNELFLCHEVAHVLAAARYGSRSHDPWFARTYLELVSVAMGVPAYLELRQSFVDSGIDFDTHSSAPAGIEL